MSEIDTLLKTLERETVNYVMGASPHNGEMVLAVAAVKQYVAELETDIKTMKDFDDLWYYAMDDAPLEFEKIVMEWSPRHWMTQIAKHRRENR